MDICGGGQGAATLTIILDLQNYDIDLLKAFHQYFLLTIKINDETIYIL